MLDRLRKWHLAADLLVASEDMALTDGIFSYFEPLGYHLENCASDMDLLDAVSQNDYAVIILDAALTDSLGIPMFIRLRSNGYTVPIILLAQNVTPKKEANFVSAGVDCVVPLPLHHLELETKLLALLRLVRGHTSTRLFWEGIELDMRKHEVACDGKPIHFPPMCFKVMAILMREAPNIVRHAALAQEIYGANPPNSDVIRAAIHNIRELLKKVDKPILRTVPRVGFQLTTINK